MSTEPRANGLLAHELKRLYSYNEETGEFWRLVSAGGRAAGTLAGGKRKDGYIQLAINGKLYLAHRLAFLYVRGEWPSMDIDHIDGNRRNNRFSNLREATKIENQQNQKRAQRNNASGFLGVSPVCQARTFTARIKVGGRQVYLGNFATANEAHEVYLAAKRQWHQGGTI
jgi:hypothetical protein